MHLKMAGVKIPDFWVLEDTGGYVGRKTRGGNPVISLRLHAIRNGIPSLLAETSYLPKAQGRRQNFRTDLALSLLKQAGVRSGILVAGARLANSPGLLKAIRAQGLEAIFAVPPGAKEEARL